MSPRCMTRSGSELLHQLSDGAHLGSIGIVSFERGDLGGECSSIVEPGGGGDECGADGGGAADPGRLQLSEGA